MIRRIIQINRDLCNGCGLCASACHEGAIAMIEGKAQLLRDDYCDGLGDCLPTCPTGAISFVEREAAPYDEKAVQTNQLARRSAALRGSAPITRSGCTAAAPITMGKEVSCLGQWPIQIQLLPVQAPFYHGASLLIAADCTAFSRADFHTRLMQGRVTLIGCPKLDSADYAEKLTEIFRQNEIREITVVRMEVPCCGGLQRAVECALHRSGKAIPCRVVTLGRNGHLSEEQEEI